MELYVSKNLQNTILQLQLKKMKYIKEPILPLRNIGWYILYTNQSYVMVMLRSATSHTKQYEILTKLHLVAVQSEVLDTKPNLENKC